MNVKTLRSLLSTSDDELTILVAPGMEFESPYLEINGIRRTLDPDTAEEIVAIQCGGDS